jgi:3-methyl-2-oxobutanoate hydroxymethyltransferase
MSATKETRKVTIPALRAMAGRAEPITMVVAYDYPSGRIADEAGIEVVLVGDSLAMTMLGQPDTLSVTMDEMLVFTRAVSRACARYGDRRHALRIIHHQRRGRRAQWAALHEGGPG